MEAMQKEDNQKKKNFIHIKNKLMNKVSNNNQVLKSINKNKKDTKGSAGN